MKLYFHPLSSYSQKVLIAFYEKDVSFKPEIVNIMTPEGRAEYTKINGFCKMPTLILDDGWKVPESSIIIEYLENHFPGKGAQLIPTDKDRARQTRFHDRIFDLYLNDSVSTLFFARRTPEAERDAKALEIAKTRLDTCYAMYDRHLEKRTFVMGDDFTMADCAAAPPLGYARMVHPFDKWKNLTAYANRLTERPSYARVLKEAQPYLAKLA